VAEDDWPLVSDVFRSAHTQDVTGAEAVLRSFREFAVAAVYDARPASERDFGSFIRSVGRSAAWLRCMLRCNTGRVLLVPHPAAELPFVAGGEEYAYLKDWLSRLRHSPAVPFGHSLVLVNIGGVGPMLALSPVGPRTAPADLALEAARRSRGELVSTRRAGHGPIFLPVRSGIGLAPARAPLPPAMALRCATPRLLTYEYPPVIHQQQTLLQAFPFHPIQGTAYVMMTAAIASGLLRAYRETQRVFEPSPCYYALTEAFSADYLASGDCSAAEALAEYDAIARAVPWAGVHERLPYHHDPTRQAPSTLLRHQVGTVADRRRHYVRIACVPRSPHAPLGVMLAELRLAGAVPRSLPVTEKAWAVPDGFPLSDPGDVSPSTEEVAASAAYHARKRRHADMERGGPAEPELANPRSPVGAAPDVPIGPAAFPASGGRWDEERHDDYPGMVGAEFGDGWPAAAVGGAGGACRDPGDHRDGGVGRGECGMTARGRRPVKETVAAARPQVATTPWGAPMAARVVGATPTPAGTGTRRHSTTAGGTPPAAPGRPPGCNATPLPAAIGTRSRGVTAGDTPPPVPGRPPGRTATPTTAAFGTRSCGVTAGDTPPPVLGWPPGRTATPTTAATGTRSPNTTAGDTPPAVPGRPLGRNATPLPAAIGTRSRGVTAGDTPPPVPGRLLGRNATSATAATGARSPAGTAWSTSPMPPVRAPGVCAPRSGTPVSTTTARRRRFWSLG